MAGFTIPQSYNELFLLELPLRVIFVMSARAAPIPLDRFAEAIADLPLGNLHAKAAELRNSIVHLVSSNAQLQEYADDGDRDCADAIIENNEVIERMEMRIGLLRTEVEIRGFRWGEDKPATVNGKAADQNNHDQVDHAENYFASATNSNFQLSTTHGGSLGDEELARRLQDQLDEEMQDDDDGVHL
ncbi:MAG: hypothetical protein LQ343_002132 [Gyalolechia ehrenbergii]|nr:MAG: hypothetical protein LQ343_002132 [Gyalolechia ehrenbergii]